MTDERHFEIKVDDNNQVLDVQFVKEGCSYPPKEWNEFADDDLCSKCNNNFVKCICSCDCKTYQDVKNIQEK